MPSTLASQNSLSDVATPIVTSYRDHLSKKAEFILSTVIPEQLDCLRVILNDPKVQSSYQEEVRHHSVTTIEEYEAALEEIHQANQAQQMQMEQALKMLFGGGMAKEEKGDEPEEAQTSSTNIDSKIVLGKRKRNNKPNSNSAMTLENKDSNVSIEVKLNEAAEEKEETAKEPPTIGINTKVYDLAKLLKPVILSLYDNCVLLRNWIVLLVPKVEDGNNFGVEVQETCLAQLKQTEIEMLMLIEEQAAYHLERAAIISKISTNSEIMDYKQYIYDADQRHCRKLQDAALTLRSNYNKLYRTITQNYDKITAPRGFNQNHLHLY